MRANTRLRVLARFLAFVFAFNGLLRFLFAMRWEHVSFDLDEALAVVVGTGVFAWLMGWLD